MISSDQFWEQLKVSGLLPEDRIDSLRKKISTKPSVAGSAVKIAKTLVANKILTEEKARSLLSGESALPQMQEATLSKLQPSSTKPKSKLPLLIGVGVILFGAGLAAVLFRPDHRQVTSVNDTQAQVVITPTEGDVSESLYELTDSAEDLWVRPKPGTPFDIPYLPPGTQVLMRVRMAEFATTPKGSIIIRSLGPNIELLLSEWLAKIGIQQHELRYLSLYLLPQGTTLPVVVLHGEFVESEACQEFTTLGQFDSQSVLKLATNAIWCPAEHPQHFYYGAWDIIKEYPTTEQGRLRRELQQLRAQSHDTDDISILANPNFLRDEAQGLFPNTRERLLDGLFAFWSDEAQAVSLGFQQDEMAFIEVRMIARDDMPPRHLAAKVDSFLKSMPSRIRDFLGNAVLDPHWQPLAMRFPQMVSFVVGNTRLVVNGKQVALTAVAPKEATHNLLLASELGLATRMRDVVAQNGEDSAMSLDSLLASTTTIRFAQKSLDQAMRDVAQQVREERRGLGFEFQIQVNGSDLQPQGITRNQQIRDFEAVNRSLADILTSLTLKANPVQGVESPSDPQQKLVWVNSPNKTGLIEITTRTAASDKSWEIPEVFRVP